MQKRSDAANLATLYDVQGKERQIVEQRAGKRLLAAISTADKTIYSPPSQAILSLSGQNLQAGGESVSISDFTTLSDEQLFLCLRDLIENERLFLQPDFGRQTLIEHTGLSKDCIGAAFAQGSDNISLPAYVRELRLDYAIRLMNDQPDITVEQVSQASGFTSADTFTRNFRAKYGMTPTAYRQTKT